MLNLDSKSYEIESKWVLISKRPIKVTNIRSFVPKGKGPESMLKFRTEAGETTDLFISRMETIFNGSVSENDRHNIEVLLQHYDVEIESLSDEDKKNLVRKGIKKASPKWLLRNVDQEQVKEYENNLSLLKIRYWLMDDENPLSTKKVIFLCTALGIAYRDLVERNYNDENKFRTQLLMRIDKQIVRSKDALKTLGKFKDQNDMLEQLFYIRKMMERKIIEIKGNLYFVGETPVGEDENSVIRYFNTNQKTFEALKDKLRSGNDLDESMIEQIIKKDSLNEDELLEEELDEIPI